MSASDLAKVRRPMVWVMGALFLSLVSAFPQAPSRLSLRPTTGGDPVAPAPAPARTSSTEDPAKVNPMESLDDKKIIAVGNLLEFRVLEDLDEEPDPKTDPKSGDARPQNLLQVSDSGEVEHSYFGRILAKGKTHRQLAEEIKQRLEKDLYYQATVMISLATTGKSRGKVYISGAVTKPGPFEIPVDENMTASKALSSVGIMEDHANMVGIKLIRKGPEGAPPADPIIINLLEIRQGQGATDRVLEPEDQLIVPAVSSRGQISIAGNVAAAGNFPIPLDRPLTVKDVIVQAKFGDFADKRRVKLFRKGEKGEPMIIDMVKILETGEEEMNPELQDGDHIFVPKRLINF
ncbi:MAG: SLBB domain-containing protein [Verrucomicrobia bacterium]|nr:SLBB domain-containing protein [Verrucomicrobiota bacterium]